MKPLNFLFEYIKTEINLILSDRSLIMILLVSPIFYSLFYGSIYLNKTSHNLPIGIIDNQKSTISRKLTNSINSHPKLKVKQEFWDFTEAKKSFSMEEVYALIVIPENFDKNLRYEKPIHIQLFLNNTRFLISNEISKALTDVLLDYNKNQVKKYYNKIGINNSRAKVLSEPINIEIKNIFNTTESYGDFLIPAIFLLILHQTLLMAASASFIISLKNRWLIISKEEKYLSILAKLLVYILFYLSYTIFLNTVIMDLFHIPKNGSLFSLLLISTLTISATFFVGVLTSTFFEDRINLFRVITLTSYPIFLLSGFSWPQNAMPKLISYVSLLVPFTAYSRAFSIVILFGGTIQNILQQLFILVFLNLISAYLLTRRLNKLSQKHKGV